VARRFESRRAPAAALPSDLVSSEESQSRLFDRTWARSLMVEAAGLQRRRAQERGGESVRRVELLRLRFEENLPIRAIAERWATDPARLHHAYAQARQEFKAALMEVVAFHHPGTPVEVEEEATGLLKALS
jgi:RNA polymerase sigma-70 factor (ECF subfamily)